MGIITRKYIQIRKKKIVPLLKISGKSYFKSRAFWTSQVLMAGIVTFETILDRLLIFPVIVSLLLVLCLGYVLALVFIEIMMTNSLGV